MTLAVMISAAILFIAALLAVIRVISGPSMLDRTIALDVFTSTLVGVIAVEAAWNKRTDTIPILVVLSMVGFVGSVTIARFAAIEPPDEAHTEEAVPGGPLSGLSNSAWASELALNDERSRIVPEDPEHHGGAAEGSVR